MITPTGSDTGYTKYLPTASANIISHAPDTAETGRKNL